MPDSADTRPIPDPTILTTEASIRLEAMLRSLIQSEITHLNELITKQFEAVYIRFNMLDARTAEQKQDTTKALSDALAAQKEQAFLQTAAAQKDTDKSALATTERIKGIEALLATWMKATDEKIGDTKDRLRTIEAMRLGSVEATANVHSSHAATWAYVVGAIGLVTGIVGIIIALLK